MKTSLLTLALSALTALAIEPAGPPPLPLAVTGKLQFDWTYPTNELSTNLTFVLFKSTDLTNWTKVATFSGTNTTAQFTLAPVGACTFALTASNFWGMTSFFSNFAYVPSVPRNDQDFKGSKAP